MSGNQMANGNRRTDLGALEQRVYSVENALTSINNALAGLSAKIDERSRTSWPTLISAGGFLLAVTLAIGALAYRPIDGALSRIEAGMPSYMSRSEAVLVRERMDRDIARLEKEVSQNDAAIVPRGEHQEKWRSYDLQLASIQRQIDDFRKDFGQTYSLKDAFADLQRKVDDLQKLARTKAQ